MHQKFRGILIIPLLLALCVLLPQGGFFARAAENTSVVLSGSVSLDEFHKNQLLSVPSGNATLDLNGKTLTVAGINVEKGATLTLTGRGHLTVTGPVRVYGDAITFSLDNDGSVTAKRSIFADNGTLTVNSGTPIFPVIIYSG